ncbi:MAG TPA: glycoside hydrolase family 38 C-terminal domain-containing protein [Fimbriimonadaceae bacterium]|nr:glycoside hydrolase family 38 C-terminal domain-containing protein [Fimbriimonadaceae bacterium]
MLLGVSGLPALGGGNGPKKAAYPPSNPRGNNPDDHNAKRDLSKGNTLYVVPYAHLDTQWRWAYPQSIREFIANTLHHNFDLIEKYPNYTFNFSGSRRYEFMKEYYPDDYAKLKQYVKEGRWFPCGSSVDENDANVPSGESIIRQVLYGNHFFRRNFGVASEEYMLPDCFGFPYSLPSLLHYCGIKGFSTQKLTWNSANGIPFKVGTWEGPDGNSIVAALDPGGYGSRVDEDLSENTSWLARIQNTGKLSGAYVDYKYYGTGDTGGAAPADSVEWVEKSIKGTGPITVVSSHADEMFRSLTPQQIKGLPHYKGELLLVEHSAGSITSEAMMKRWNRKNELLAQGAEEASVAASWLGRAPYPSDRLYNAWDLVLGSQMHDMLPGTSIPKAYNFCWNDELLAQNQFGAVETDGVGAVASAMDTRGTGTPIVVYNPLSVARTDVVEVTVPASAAAKGNLVSVVAPDGRESTGQVVKNDAQGEHILFVASVPSCGLATYRVNVDRPGKAGAMIGSMNGNSGTVWFDSESFLGALHTRDGRQRLEGKKLEVTINANGDISSIYDKVNRREILKAPTRLDFQYENPSAFPAWNMDWDDAKKPPYDHVHGPAKITIKENGPVRSMIEVERETRGSKFVQDISLDAVSDVVRVENKIDWRTKETALKAAFPLTTGNPEATYDLQLGATKRGNNQPRKYEVPQQQWFDLTKPDGSYGVGILNDSKFGSDKPDDDTVRLTMIYTPGVRGGTPDQSTQDIGRHDIVFEIAPHKGDWRSAGVPWQAKRLNQPLRAFVVPPHSGPLGKSFSLFTTNTQQVEIQAIKKAEDSNEIVVRLRELDGRAAKNVRISAAYGIASAREVNGQERAMGPATVKNGVLATSVPGFSLRSFAIRLRPAPRAAATLTESKPVALPYDFDAISWLKNPGNGDFAQGQALSADQLPSSLVVDGIDFKFGPKTDGAKNAVAAHGQTIALPAGYKRVYVLAAAGNGDDYAKFKVGSHPAYADVEYWTHYIGQWDNRLWSAKQDENYQNYGTMVGLEPGYVKKAEVAWFCDHTHVVDGNTYYQYSYLFKYGFDIPAGAHTLTLPNDPNIKIMAITVARDTHDQATPAHPLSDTLADHKATGGPEVSPSGGTFHDATQVTIEPPLYYHGGGIHYTLDGSTPTASSPTYVQPFMVSNPTTVKAAEIDSAGHSSAVTAVKLDVDDTTPPHVVSAVEIKPIGMVRLTFSEPLDPASAQDASDYSLAGASGTAQLNPDRRTVTLRFTGAIDGSSISVHGVKDCSQSGNAMAPTQVNLTDGGAVIDQASFDPSTTKLLRVENLPVKKTDSWTLNFFCKPDAKPEDRTMIAGFGNARDGDSGTGRYFCVFPAGINFWVCDRDVRTTVPIDLGKWQMLTATYDGTTMRLYKDGEPIAEKQVALVDDVSQARVMPIDAWDHRRRFQGEVRDFSVWDIDLPPDVIKSMYTSDKG